MTREPGEPSSPSVDAGGGNASFPFPDVVNGATYFPASAYNVDQTWLEYDSAITERDLGYAAKINLNALRVYGSYYAYQRNESIYQSHVDDLLDTASAKGMRVVFVLYEGSGDGEVDATLRALKDPLRAVAVQSVPAQLAADASQWQPFRDHVLWFMSRYKDDARLLAIEVVNEAGPGVRPFASAMLQVARANKGAVPLTMGTPRDSLAAYASDGIDVLQLRDVFPRDLDESRSVIEQSLALARNLQLPLWTTEWQRLRQSGPNWNGEVASPASERYPELAPMAAQIKGYEAELGTFFRSLMIKPAFLEGQRNAGTINGLFWEDGAVWDLSSARIIAGDPDLVLPERKREPFEILRFHSAAAASALQCNEVSDGTGQGHNVSAAAGTSSGDEFAWRLVRIDNEAYFRLESVRCQQWLQCTRLEDATLGKPDPVADANTLAVRAVARTNIGDQTRWRLVPTPDGDWRFFLQNKDTGYYLEVTALPDLEEGAAGALQVRAVPSSKTGPSTRFRSADASH